VLLNTWKCAWDSYGSGDGCDCGCGAIDPDCGGLGCTSARCFDSSCYACHDEQGRPYSCDAAQAGWDNDTLETSGPQPSLCLSTHFDSDDGCDCGCGGPDPDCGGDGCSEWGCGDAACDRCTDASGNPGGCAPSAWLAAQCDPRNYGTGDGCDCGCGTPDPDCAANQGCTTAGCTDGAACEVCNNGAGGFVECDGWTCENGEAFGGTACDCGCGVIDPTCRRLSRASCTGTGCEVTTCQFCNAAGGERSACGGEWEAANSTCDVNLYGRDGLCDCGCAVDDPDCAGDGCTDANCNAPACDVCRGVNTVIACREWTCDADRYDADDGCDCGCGAPDPDCGTGGCVEPGCRVLNDSCDACYDPFGRSVGCP
jgi:hypothetical protein